MDVNCNCFGVATAAKVPVKRYNLLVPAIFPVTEPSCKKPLSIGTEKNIKRLGEYAERNEHRVPKVSRRLARRLHADLAHGRLGFVRVAVAAYAHLVTVEDGRFARLCAKELVIKFPSKPSHFWSLGPRPKPARLPPSSAHLGSVVGALASHEDPEAQRWGLELLLTLLKQQGSAEFIENFEAFVPLVCAKAATRDGGAVATVVAVALQALLEHLRFCFRISYVSQNLDAITWAVLGIVDAEGQGATYASAVEALAAGVNPLALSKQSIGARVGASSPGLAALLVYRELGYMTRDAAEGQKVLEHLFRYLDERPEGWTGSIALDTGLGVMRDACSAEHQRYLLASALMAHAGAASCLPPLQRAGVVAQAAKDGAALEQGMVPWALVLALQEMPKVLVDADTARKTANAEEAAAAAALEAAALAAVSSLAGKVGSRLQLTSVLGAALSRVAGPIPAAAASLRCCAAAAAAYEGLAEEQQAAAGPAPHLSNAMLRAALGVCLQREPELRILAHTVLTSAFKGVPPGSYPRQIHLVLSALWHEAGLPDNTPACFAAMDAMLAAAMEAGAGGTEGALRLSQFATALQAEAVAAEKGEGRLAGVSPAQRWAVAALCGCMWERLAQRLDCPALAKLSLLCGSGGTKPKNGAGAAWSLPSLHLTAPGLETIIPSATSFTAADHEAAERLLAGWSVDSSHAWLTRAKAAFAGVPGFSGFGEGEMTAFVPLPLASIAPHVTLAAASLVEAGGRGSGAAAGQALSPQARRLQAALAARTVPGALLVAEKNGEPARIDVKNPKQPAVAAENPLPEGGDSLGAPKSLAEVFVSVEMALSRVANV